jgi:hypothetical protein
VVAGPERGIQRTGLDKLIGDLRELRSIPGGMRVDHDEFVAIFNSALFQRQFTPHYAGSGARLKGRDRSANIDPQELTRQY